MRWFLNNKPVEEQFDPIVQVEGLEMMLIKTIYVFMVPEDSEPKQDRGLALHPYKYSKHEYYNDNYLKCQFFCA